MRRLAGLLVVLALAGCSWGDSAAERLAKDRATLLGRQMTIGVSPDFTALDLVRRAPDDPEVSFLRADGTSRAQNVVIVARITARYPSQKFSTDDPEATMCFEYQYGGWTGAGDDPKVVGCPSGPPLVISIPPPPPSLPADALKRVTAALKGLPNADEASVRAAVGATITEPGATFDVLAHDGWTGIAVRAGSDCLLARVDGKATEVWVPPRVTIQPGELTCSADTAALGLAKKGPH
ncbi:hypothetical protein [Tenggerimyces flavus]|uniref:Lipoprotein n=1 Tax=Tenggerimyces flavus TaxID=1708749 RepID=A0ABV7Y7Q4_9ACTN|nr:hypothetical protein [Tenggerimyces flavus]MBM7785591.1 hypothetical protein [Tenggerimyces flavus]